MIEGQKVVCINDEAPFWLRNRYSVWLKKGTTYVVRGVFLGKNMKGEAGEVGVYLLGIQNPFHTYPPHPELGYNSERFRPLDEMPPKKKAVEQPVSAPVRELVEV